MSPKEHFAVLVCGIARFFAVNVAPLWITFLSPVFTEAHSLPTHVIHDLFWTLLSLIAQSFDLLSTSSSTASHVCLLNQSNKNSPRPLWGKTFLLLSFLLSLFQKPLEGTIKLSTNMKEIWRFAQCTHGLLAAWEARPEIWGGGETNKLTNTDTGQCFSVSHPEMLESTFTDVYVWTELACSVQLWCGSSSCWQACPPLAFSMWAR